MPSSVVESNKPEPYTIEPGTAALVAASLRESVLKSTTAMKERDSEL